MAKNDFLVCSLETFKTLTRDQMVEEYERLLGANLLNRNAVRLQREKVEQERGLLCATQDLVVEARNEAAEWKRRYEALLADLT